MNSPTNNWR